MYSPSPLPLFNTAPKNQSESNVVINRFIFLELKLSTVLRAKLQSAIFHQSPRERERDTRWRRQRPRERGWSGHPLPCPLGGVQSDLVKRRGGQGGACGWEMTPEGTPKPRLQKERHQALAEGEPPSAPQKRGPQRGRKEQSGGPHKGIGIFKFF